MAWHTETTITLRLRVTPSVHTDRSALPRLPGLPTAAVLGVSLACPQTKEARVRGRRARVWPAQGVGGAVVYTNEAPLARVPLLPLGHVPRVARDHRED